MIIKDISLKEYRNYISLDYSPQKGINILYGKNGSGKTNILEAIHLCCLGKSHRTNFDRELIRHDMDRALINVKSSSKKGSNSLKIVLERRNKKTKEIYINNKKTNRIGELMGHINCVLFSSEDLRMIKEGPSLRRKFMDMQLSQTSPKYFFALQRYQTALQHRNKLLRNIENLAKKDDSQEEYLDVWDNQLSKEAVIIVEERAKFINIMRDKVKEAYFFLSENKKEKLSISLKTPLKLKENIYDQMREGLLKSRSEDKKYKQTAFGPHRDDLNILLEKKDIKAFGSQGQIRTTALCLKLAQLDMIIEEKKDSPILLLDDVMSELDSYRKNRLLEKIKGVQTFITCTDKNDVSNIRVDEYIKVSKDTDGYGYIEIH